MFGIPVDENLKTSKEALEAGGLLWTVDKQPLTAHLPYGPDGTNKLVPGKYANTRMDTLDVVGIVGKNFRNVQNEEAALILDALAQEVELKFKRVGDIDRGARVWMECELPGEVRIKETEDVIKQYVTMTNAFNGTKSYVMHVTPIRQKNQTAMNITYGMSDAISIRHTKKFDDHIKEARKILKFQNDYLAELSTVFNSLADIKVGKDDFISILDTLMPLSTDPEVNNTKTENSRNKLSNLYLAENIDAELPDTGWSLFCAVSNYADNYRSFKSSDDTTKEQNRFLAILEGESQAIKDRTITALLGN